MSDIKVSENSRKIIVRGMVFDYALKVAENKDLTRTDLAAIFIQLAQELERE